MQSIRTYWDWRASSFDNTSARQQSWWQVYNHILNGSARQCILDAGTGTGFIATGLAEKGHMVTGIDLSPVMLQLARAATAEKKINLQFLAADAVDPPFRPESFDAVVCRNLLWTIPDPGLALRRWHKILKSGGKLVVSDGIWRSSGFKGVLNQYVRLIFSVMKKGFSSSTPLRFAVAYGSCRDKLPYLNGIHADAARELLLGSGFSQPVQHEHLFTRHPYPTGYGSRFFVISAARP
ncbi:MAG: class I SAM-dependent methyltransferase [Desulfobulbaceae bacterium]|nr:class I SAM-dependent methyltransferase [Desulfobulbaceae bacterium]